MRAARWIFIIAGIAITLPTFAAKPTAKTTCGLKRYASLDMSVSPGLVKIPVLVEGTPAWMTLNIQSSMTVMWKDDANRMNLSRRMIPGNAEVRFGAQRISEYAIARSFKLGEAEFQKSEFLVVPEATRYIDPADPTIGALGLDFLGRMDFELDFKNKKMNLFSQDHCPGEGVYWADTYAASPLRRGKLGNAYLPFELDGKKIQAALSTGTEMTSLPTSLTRRMYGFDEHSPGIEIEKDAAGQIKAQYRAMAITAPGLILNNTRVRLLTQSPTCRLNVNSGPDSAAQYVDCLGDDAPMRIGLGVLEKLHLYFAMKDNFVYYTAADATHTKEPERSSPQ
jgi:hypothetical protein